MPAVFFCALEVAEPAEDPEGSRMRDESASVLSGRPITLALCGDVMLGRGIDQLLEHPGPHELREAFVTDARDYIGLAEDASGLIPYPVSPDYVWGEALGVLDALRPDVRLVNLETAITADGCFWPDKEIHYRMHPANLVALKAAGVDVCTLANNHVLDFGRQGLLDTTQALDEAGIARCGAGADIREARTPARLPLPGGRRLHVFGLGHGSSGIAPDWAAGAARPGVDRLPDLSLRTADEVLARIHAEQRPGTISVVSIHWGSNWGHAIFPDQLAFARRLIEGGVALVHGHSSHHPRALEVHRGRLILFGSGDFINDYEGIGGYERYRSELRPLYLPSLAEDGRLLRLRIYVFESHKLRLRRAGSKDTRWLAAELASASRRFGTRILPREAGELQLALR